MSNNLPLIVICGPTGTGKTDLALKLCHQFNGEIISADSRQIYRGADIGTNKTKPCHQAHLKHPVFNSRSTTTNSKSGLVENSIKIYLYDVIEPDTVFSVAEFIDLADQALSEVINQGKMAFLVGGTGFYIHAFLGETEYSDTKPNWEMRKRLAGRSVNQLVNQLKELDAVALEKMSSSDRHNPHRLIRYIELARAAGSVKAASIKHQPSIPAQNTLKIGLTAPCEILYQKADNWTVDIVDHGLVEETQELLKAYGPDISLLKGLIYAPAVSFIGQEIGKNELVERIQFQLHAYIRRQLTWFNKDNQIRWFNITVPGWEEKVVGEVGVRD